MNTAENGSRWAWLDICIPIGGGSRRATFGPKKPAAVTGVLRLSSLAGTVKLAVVLVVKLTVVLIALSSSLDTEMLVLLLGGGLWRAGGGDDGGEKQRSERETQGSTRPLVLRVSGRREEGLSVGPEWQRARTGSSMRCMASSSEKGGDGSSPLAGLLARSLEPPRQRSFPEDSNAANGRERRRRLTCRANFSPYKRNVHKI